VVNIAPIERIVRRLVKPVYLRTQLMVLRSVVNLVDDSGGIQLLQVDSLADRTADAVEHFQPLGLSSVPSRDAECVALAVGGNQDHPIAIGVQDRSYRPTGLAEGETTVYDKTGSRLHLKSDGDVAMVPSGAYVHIGEDPGASPAARSDYTDSRISALEVAHNALVDAFNAAVIIYNAHVHAAPGSPPSPPLMIAAASLTPGSSTAAGKVKIT